MYLFLYKIDNKKMYDLLLKLISPLDSNISYNTELYS